MTVLSAAGDLGIVLAIFALCGAAGAMFVRLPALCRPTPERGRYGFLDGLRGIAAVSVLASHFAQQVKVALHWPGDGHVFTNLGAFGVQIFFALTGFLFTYKMIEAPDGIAVRSFMASRIRRILPMYSVSVFAAVVILCSIFSQKTDTIGQFTRSIILFYAAGIVNDVPMANIGGVPYWRVLPQIWSLPLEWLFYALIPLLCVCFHSTKLLATLVIVSVVYFSALTGASTHAVFMPYFAPGMLLAYVTHRGIAVPASWRPGLLVVVAGLSLIATLSVNYGSYGFTWWGLALMFGIFGSVVLMEPPALASRTITWLGQISYSIYLMHYPILVLILYPFVSIRQHGVLALLVLAGGICLTLGLSALTFRFVEYPFLSHKPARLGISASEVLTRPATVNESQAATRRGAVAAAIRAGTSAWEAIRQQAFVRKRSGNA